MANQSSQQRRDLHMIKSLNSKVAKLNAKMNNLSMQVVEIKFNLLDKIQEARDETRKNQSALHDELLNHMSSTFLSAGKHNSR